MEAAVAAAEEGAAWQAEGGGGRGDQVSVQHA